MSKVISTGSLITEGPHLYLDKTKPLHPQALKKFIYLVQQIYEERQLDAIVIRDFYESDDLIDKSFCNEGFLRLNIMERYVINLENTASENDFYNSLSKRSKQHFREDVKKYLKHFDFEYADEISKEETEIIYKLYSNVSNKNLTINSHLLPLNFFSSFAKLPNSEYILLRIKNQDGSITPEVVSAILCYKTKNSYIPLIIGMNYNYLKPFKIYKQSLYQIVRRALLLKKNTVLMGFGAPIEKRKVNGKEMKAFGYFLFRETFHLDILPNI